MRNVLIAALALSSSVALAEKAAAPAAAAAAPMKMEHAPELVEAGKFFVGKWACTGKQAASPMGPARNYKSKLEMKWDLGGFWLMGRVDEEKTKENPTPMSLTFAVGWDPLTKKITRNDYFLGGGWANLTTSGFEGDKLVFAGEQVMMGRKMPLKHSMTKKDGEFSGSFETNGPDGKPMVMFEETCKKSGGKK